MSLVFCYGSNLDAEGRDAWMRGQGHAGRPPRTAGTALLLDRRLSFERFARSRNGGVLTLSVAPGHVVDGALLEADDALLALLDRKEGHPDAYLRERTDAILPDGRLQEAWLYDVPPQRRHGHVPPTQSYLDSVRRGLAAHGLPAAALEAAAQQRPFRPAVPWMFVYGTLRAGGANAALLAGLTRHPATAAGLLHDLGAYPAMTLGPGEVAGEVVPLDPARLAALDALEQALPFGAPGGAYRRTVLRVRLADGSHLRAQVYVMDSCAAPRIPHGDWARLGDRRAAWAARPLGA
ncbi:gamma-glutamylcyclotransferase [Roseococcus sp. DSY-14]|uniref:gamma-glutamylcyclotransferase n=1 Tax=Roseococcus sp. DSY-14 TaxID=3369650 RepID=UPI00387AB7FC